MEQKRGVGYSWLCMEQKEELDIVGYVYKREELDIVGLYKRGVGHSWLCMEQKRGVWI